MSIELISFLIFILLIIILVLLTNSKSSKKLISKAHEYENQGQYLDALDYYAQYSLEEAINMVLRAPEASQVLVLRRLEKKYTQTNIERIFIRIARSKLMKNDFQAAVRAFVLAKKPFAAAKVYIDAGGLEYIPAAVQVLDKNASLLHNRDQAIRNLAKYAYNNRKFMETAELLKIIGADEESKTVLVVAASEMKNDESNVTTKQYVSSFDQKTVAVRNYLKELKDLIQNGDFEKMRKTLVNTKSIVEKIKKDEERSEIEKINPLIKEIDEFDRLLKILDSARDILRKNNTNQAIVLYDELLENLGSNTPTSIYAEAALANEEKNPQYAAELYQKAAKKVKSSRAAESFKMRARKIGIEIERIPLSIEKSVTESLDEVEEHCSVCRMLISDITNLVRCPECGFPAHYGHLAEWIKIRGVCPICKKKIKIIRPRKLTI